MRMRFRAIECTENQMTALVVSARLVLGTVFLLSAITKLASPGQFAKDVQSYRIPGFAATPFAWGLTFAELGVAGLLLTGHLSSWAAAAAAVMLIAFMIAVASAMARGLNLSCGCFGILYREKVGWSTQFRDGALLLAALIVLAKDNGSMAIGAIASSPVDPGNAAILGVTALALGFSIVVAVLTAIQAKRTKEARPHGG